MNDSTNNAKRMCEDNFQHLMTLDCPILRLVIEAIDWNKVDFSLKEREKDE